MIILYFIFIIFYNVNLKLVNTVWDCSCPTRFSGRCLYWIENSLSSGLGLHTGSQTNELTDRLKFHVRCYIQESEKETYYFSLQKVTLQTILQLTNTRYT